MSMLSKDAPLTQKYIENVTKSIPNDLDDRLIKLKNDINMQLSLNAFR